MSLHKAKTLYCIAIIATGIILAVLAGPIGKVAAIALLAGTLPMIRAIEWAASDQGADKAILDLRDRWQSQQNEETKRDEETDEPPHPPANRQ